MAIIMVTVKFHMQHESFIHLHPYKKNKTKEDFQMRFLSALQDIHLTEIMVNFGLVMINICTLYISSIQATHIALV